MASEFVLGVLIALACPPESDTDPARVPAPQVAKAAPALPAAPIASPGAVAEPRDPRYGLLTPLPESGGLPPIYGMLHGPTQSELEFRARARGYEKQISEIRHKFFNNRNQELRQQGLAQIREFTDPAAFQPMFEVLRREDDSIRLAVLDHLAAQGDLGQAALAWIAIDMAGKESSGLREVALRNEAIRRMTQPASGAVLSVIDGSLRSQTHRLANNAGALAGALNAVQTIPLLIFAQVTQDAVADTGDLAWIAIGTQTLFVVDLNPVVGNGVVAFEPVVATVTEGTVMRVLDAVAISYRVDVHRSLVAMSSHEWGQSTEHLGYDPRKWWAWYNAEFVPAMQKKLDIERMANPADPPANPKG